MWLMTNASRGRSMTIRTAAMHLEIGLAHGRLGKVDLGGVNADIGRAAGGEPVREGRRREAGAVERGGEHRGAATV